MRDGTGEALSAAEVIEAVRATGHGRVKVAVADIDGVLRGKYLHVDKFAAAVQGGFGFCSVVLGWDAGDVCYDNTAYTGWHTGYPDAIVRLDLATFRRVPWDGDIPFFLGEFVEADGSPLGVCPRQVLRRVLKQAAAMGLTPAIGMEFEWFNFSETPASLRDKGFVRPEPITPGMFGYSLLRSNQNQPFFAAVMQEMAAFGVPIEGLHTETGPGVLEAALLYGDALTAADRALLFKSGVKEIGHRFGIMPSFMAKWKASLPGCSGHVHQSLNDSRGHNVFFDAAAPYHMSPVFRSYLAGQMKLMGALLPCYAPTINSYKRLVEGAWAPTKVNWGVDNRTVALRVISGSSKSTRLETRVIGADVNPYIAMAAAIGSGLWGIQEALELPSGPIAGNGYRDETAEVLPSNLAEATERLDGSGVARTLLGDAFVDHFVATRRWEWRQYQAAVTDWELERYFEII